jgi:hypothetical protein
MLALLMLSASALVFTTVDGTDCGDGENALQTIVTSVQDSCGSGHECLDVDACETAIGNIGASDFADIKADLATCGTDDEKNQYQTQMINIVIMAYKCGAQSELGNVTGSTAATEAVTGAVRYADLLIESCAADCKEVDDERRRRDTLSNSNNGDGDSGSAESGSDFSTSGSGSDSGSESGSASEENEDENEDGCEFPFHDCDLDECIAGQSEFGTLCSANDKCTTAIDALLADATQLGQLADFIAAIDDENDSRARRAGHVAGVITTLNGIKADCAHTPNPETTTAGPTTTESGAADMVASLTLFIASSVFVALL